MKIGFSFRQFVVVTAFIVSQRALADSVPPESKDDEIIVTATPAEQRRIDREIYDVKDNAQSQTETGLQLVRRIPSITVNSDGNVQLLGDPNVKVLVDGHPVTNGSRFLKTLSASQIARVEVMTNPSAAYSAEGAAGAINIIMRRQVGSGFGGSGTITREDFGGIIFKAAPTFASGPWSVSLALTSDNSRFNNRLKQERISVDPTNAYTMTKNNASRDKNRAVHAEINYKASKIHNFTLSLDHSNYNTSIFTDQLSEYRGSLVFPQSRVTNALNEYHNNSASFTYSRSGEKQGEELSLSAKYNNTRQPSRDLINEDYGTTSSSRFIEHNEEIRSIELDTNYSLPLHRKAVLNIGGSIVRAFQSQHDSIGENLAPIPSIPNHVEGTWTTFSAFATVQFSIAGWTLAPGLRSESRNASSNVLSENSIRSYLFSFPSFHMERTLSKKSKLSFSYSRRVEWPTLNQINPSIRYYDPLNGYKGNPDLRPQLTDSFEGNISYNFNKQTTNLKLYNRITKYAWLDQVQLSNGIILISPENIGSLRRLGVELSAQGSFGKSWSYSTTIDLLSRHSTVFNQNIISPVQQFAYSGSVQLDYKEADEDKKGSDHISLDIEHTGPTTSFQTRSSSYTTASMTWTHGISSRLSTVVTVNDLLGNNGWTSGIIGSDYSQFTRRYDDGRRVEASLVWRFGK